MLGTRDYRDQPSFRPRRSAGSPHRRHRTPASHSATASGYPFGAFSNGAGQPFRESDVCVGTNESAEVERRFPFAPARRPRAV